MTGVSSALSNILVPLRTFRGEYMRKIGNGEIPERITEEYRGEFNDIKDSINACIEGLGGLAEGKAILGRMSNNDYSEKVEGSYLGIYAEIQGSINEVIDRIRRTINVLNDLAKGDLSDLKVVMSCSQEKRSGTPWCRLCRCCLGTYSH